MSSNDLSEVYRRAVLREETAQDPARRQVLPQGDVIGGVQAAQESAGTGGLDSTRRRTDQNDRSGKLVDRQAVTPAGVTVHRSSPVLRAKSASSGGEYEAR